MSDIYNRFTVAILAIVDSADSAATQTQIKAALSALPKVRVKQISFDMWTNGQDGSERQFDEDGKEILPASSVPETSTNFTPDVEAEEVKA